MMHRPLALLLALAITPLAAQRPATEIGWLAGCWLNQSGDRETVEIWTPPGGGMMVGGSRTSAGTLARGFEYLRIRTTDVGLIYTAIPSGQTETDFTSTEVTDSSFTVENPAHDFPTLLRYTYRRAVDSLLVDVQGPAADGGTGGFMIRFVRTACRVVPPGSP